MMRQFLSFKTMAVSDLCVTHAHVLLYHSTVYCTEGKFGKGETLTNSVNDHKFAKVSPTKLYASIKFVE